MVSVIPDETLAKWQRIVDLMAWILEVPAALIMRVHPEQIEVLVGSDSVGNPYEPGERADLNTGLYCEAVMARQAKLLVPDARVDPEWEHNPDIELGMTFYLGYPIRSPSGEVFGTICVLDSKENPRAIEYEKLIEKFRNVVEGDLKSLVNAAALQESQRRLADAERLAHIGTWELDLEKNKLWWSDEVYRIFGLAPQEFGATLEAFLEAVHPDDREYVAKAYGDAVKNETPYDIVHRVLRRDGEIRWVREISEETRDETRAAKRSVGAVLDITEIKRMEQELRELNEQLEQRVRQRTAEIARLKDRLEAENIYLQEEIRSAHGFENIVGDSVALNEVLHKVDQVADTDATVLLLGETGTGKELIAHAIHARSRRKNHPLIKVDCAALPATLIESELFGHEKGAFTGAVSRRAGRFEVADGGTLFLDEIGDLPHDLQSNLLRVLQDGEFERLGSTRTQKVDVRVIAATNRNLREQVASGRFRSDLYYRLLVFPIEIPPLRERREDIPLLIWHFIVEWQARMGKKIDHIPRRTMDRLVKYAWPGNVRELCNVVERALILSPGPTLQVEESLGPPALATVGAASSDAQNLAHVERAHIQSVLEECGWKVKGTGNAADRLGLNPSTLRSRMKKLGIARP
jgi:PAS domain S-box-containing protein